MLRLLRSTSLWAALVLLTSLPAFAAPKVGQPAPALVVKTLNGSMFDLASERGRVVVLDVWATWCSPCRAEMPVLNAFYKQFHSRGVDLLGLSADDSHDAGTVRSVMKEFLFPAAILASARKNGFGRPRIVPMTYVFDRKGILRAKLWPRGTPVTVRNLKKTIQPLLAKADTTG